jgi:hypothetical protein
MASKPILNISSKGKKRGSPQHSYNSNKTYRSYFSANIPSESNADPVKNSRRHSKKLGQVTRRRKRQNKRDVLRKCDIKADIKHRQRWKRRFTDRRRRLNYGIPFVSNEFDTHFDSPDNHGGEPNYYSRAVALQKLIQWPKEEAKQAEQRYKNSLERKADTILAGYKEIEKEQRAIYNIIAKQIGQRGLTKEQQAILKKHLEERISVSGSAKEEELLDKLRAVA